MPSRTHEHVVTLRLLPPRPLATEELRAAAAALTQDRPPWVLAVRAVEPGQAVELMCKCPGAQVAEAAQRSIDDVRAYLAMDHQFARWVVDARSVQVVEVPSRSPHGRTNPGEPAPTT
jgi:hypothetical protein